MKRKVEAGRRGRLHVPAGLGALTLLALLAASALPGRAGESTPAPNRYIGSSKCKNCHSSEEGGNQYGAWSAAKHSHAYATLSSDAAKAEAAARGVDDPLAGDDCLRCHTTTHGVEPDLVKRGFKIEEGVGCETCHGPGEQHMKARFAAAAGGGGDEGFGDEASGVPEGEIITSPPMATCVRCHNEEATGFKGFCFWEYSKKIRHWDPRREHPADEVECGCGHPEGHTCTDACRGG